MDFSMALVFANYFFAVYRAESFDNRACPQNGRFDVSLPSKGNTASFQ
jgi:hypothetical protein